MSTMLANPELQQGDWYKLNQVYKNHVPKAHRFRKFFPILGHVGRKFPISCCEGMNYPRSPRGMLRSTWDKVDPPKSKEEASPEEYCVKCVKWWPQ